ncbi:hypothetical protein E2562_014219 [Oryza meyeriana var. granulata]|uniref:Uncharacterized protein n=1 Tax=Oryza meyeriana var. granulata TaxID=110450 RepID=A0A6G1BKK8_9ORYZ|nr:hypothetical protein E2562_014219 [Oryza meyeriana var. granulata]
MAPPLTSGISSGLDDGKGCLKEAVRERGAGALHLAAGRGRSSVCAYLVEELQVDVHHADDSGYTPLAYAVRGGTVDCVRYLLDHGANTDKRGKDGLAPLHLATVQGKCDIAKVLLSKGADVDAFSDRGTPLHLAAFFKQDGVMKILLDHHADAVNFCPDDPTLFSNKSLCWMKMGEGVQALMDAQACRMLRPDWPKACYLEGAA